MKVKDRILRSEVQGHVIGARWVYVKKPNVVRCRLVAQEFAGSEKREDLYAGTPPMAATRYLLSDIVSRGRNNRKGKLMVVDVKRAFLHGLCTRSIYVELPGAESQGGEVRWKTHQVVVRDPGRAARVAHRRQEGDERNGIH